MSRPECDDVTQTLAKRLDPRENGRLAVFRQRWAFYPSQIRGGYTRRGTTCVSCAPTLREPVPQYRAIRRDELSKVVKDLQAQNDLLAEIQHALSAAQAAIRAYRDTMRQALAPVSCLPVEILREIYLWAVYSHEESSNFRRIDVATSISHVCLHWRGVACSIPELWQDIRVTPMDSAELFEAWSSRGRLIRPDRDFIMTLVPTHMPSSSTGAPPILATLDRTGRLVSKSQDDISVGGFFTNLQLWRAWPILRRLTRLIVESVEVESSADCHPIELFVAPFPGLEHLELANFILSTTILAEVSRIRPVVKTLICRQSSIPDIFWHNFKDLEELQLTQCYCEDVFNVDRGLCIFPELSTLVAHNCDANFLQAAFRTIRAPALVCLDINILPEANVDLVYFVYQVFSVLAPHVSADQNPEISTFRLTACSRQGQAAR